MLWEDTLCGFRTASCYCKHSASKVPAIVTALGQGKIFAAEEGSLKYTM